ncbi:threonine ammonia-lyase, biosynthetic [Candidatus Marinamargulisbacteria bacterium SCGC AG-343-K17]|nr:threonine ammonia-lyase, biosynthetic [Candidatus Marinamargulisbacteria bacterium SCGC AG-343-K17]
MNLTNIHDKVLSADVSGVSIMTPLQYASRLSKKLQNNIYMKREDMQSVFSFKCRGAFNKIRQLSNHDKSLGIIAASAGNHAQGVALSAQQLNINATIVMPQTTPQIKINAVRALDAEVILHGDSYDDACSHAHAISSQKGLIFIHPYDDEEVIAGQGTLGLEILDQLSEPIDYIFVAVGGGGLLAGIIAVFKVLSPSTKVIAVEPDNSDCLSQALAKKERVILDQVGIFTDGVAVKQIGEITFPIIEPHVDDSICVSIDEICSSIKDIYEETRSIVEPAGALSLAGLKKYLEVHNIQDKNMITINCGANMNFDRLRHIAERTDIGEHKEALLSVQIPEKPGALLAFCHTIGHRTITEFNYRYQSSDQAMIFVGIEKDDDFDGLLTKLTQDGYKNTDLSEDECAKIHVRHMIGGIPTPPLVNEQIIRVQFPERPGALLEFLNALNNRWNITLFHYRNHGAAYGRVLVGLDVPKNDMNDFNQFISNLGFRSYVETNNRAITNFLMAGETK